MKELADILKAYQPDVSAALATVVKVQGSAYRRPGARMLVFGDGKTVGGVSGGCLERDVIQRAGAIMLSNQPALVRYDTTLDPESGSGYSLGCGGAIDVLIEPLNTPGGVQLMSWLKSTGDCAAVIATVVSKRSILGQRMMVGQSVEGQIGTDAFSKTILEDARKALLAGRSFCSVYPTLSGDVEIFFELIKPPLDLLIFGAGSDAVPLVGFGKSLGWRVTVVDVRSSAMDPDRVWEADAVIRCGVDEVNSRVAISPSAAAVVMTHNFSHDSQLVQLLAKKSLRYLGLLGPRHRTAEVLGDLKVEGIHSPIGLDLGADNPQEVALAIVAEITAVLRGRSGLPLRAIDGPIHVDSPQESLSLTSSYRAASCPVAGS
jgi:xanthine dehydrogenase accessory factor